MNRNGDKQTAHDERGTRPVAAEFRARARARRVPLRVTFELTKRCNLACHHCYVVRERDEELATARWLELVDEVTELGCVTLALTGGEFGLREDWLTIAEGARKRGLLLSLMTNGTLFTPDDLRAIADLRPREVAVSLYGPDDRTHDAITRRPGSFSATVRTIQGLRAQGVRVHVGCVLMKSTIDGFVPLRKLAESMGCTFRFDPTVSPREDGSIDVLEHRVAIDELRRFYLDEIVMPLSREGKLVSQGPSPRTGSKITGNCSAGFTSATIEAHGDVLPCPGFRPALGNVRTQSFADVWHGKQAESHRELMDAPLRECVECDLLPYCTVRCPKLAQLETGDLSGAFGRACELAAMIRDMREQWIESADSVSEPGRGTSVGEPALSGGEVKVEEVREAIC